MSQTQVAPIWEHPSAQAVASPYMYFPETWNPVATQGAGLRRTHRPLTQPEYERPYKTTSFSGSYEACVAEPGHTLPGWLAPVPFTPEPDNAARFSKSRKGEMLPTFGMTSAAMVPGYRLPWQAPVQPLYSG
eukprot:NODE_938_length_550_cov_328.224586_g928_i0.p1 GENE.NODE_938_length_550_cov_328.224586_g928_i0~~NODE_938_length_550_cov_328.224586_g928_i0.p1  ORF type:complete len:132 (-),score=25.23 NODE_938_length_550_cov_328.224586_g928_i0:95-490(-)